MFNFLGLLVAVGVLVGSMLWGNPNPGRMLDMHALLIVVGGTFGCVAVAFRIDHAAKLVGIFFRGFFKVRVSPLKGIVEELIPICEAYRNSAPDLAQKAKAVDDPFLREALEALIEKISDDKTLIRMLHVRVDTMYSRYRDEAKMFEAMGKYPPAMGLLGAVLGMINLLGSVGQEGAEAMIGPAMAVAMVATLYGIALANLFVIPIGENLQEVAKKIKRKNLLVVHAVQLISEKVHPMLLVEELNSFLLPSERLDWKKGK